MAKLQRRAGDVGDATLTTHEDIFTLRCSLKGCIVARKRQSLPQGGGGNGQRHCSTAPVSASAVPVPSKYLEPDSAHPGWGAAQSYSWNVYKDLSQGEKDYAGQFCAANPSGTAGVPKEKPAHAIDCAGLRKAKKELGQ
jgi:hypothetical protein